MLSPCPPPPAPTMLSKIPDINATRNTKLSPNVTGDTRMQMIEIVLIFSDLQKSSYGPDFRAVVRPQALVRDFPSFLHF